MHFITLHLSQVRRRPRAVAPRRRRRRRARWRRRDRHRSHARVGAPRARGARRGDARTVTRRGEGDALLTRRIVLYRFTPRRCMPTRARRPTRSRGASGRETPTPPTVCDTTTVLLVAVSALSPPPTRASRFQVRRTARRRDGASRAARGVRGTCALGVWRRARPRRRGERAARVGVQPRRERGASRRGRRGRVAGVLRSNFGKMVWRARIRLDATLKVTVRNAAAHVPNDCERENAALPTVLAGTSGDFGRLPPTPPGEGFVWPLGSGGGDTAAAVTAAVATR